MKHTRWIYFFVMCAMLLFGCGSDDDTTPNPDPSDNPPSGTTNPDDTVPDPHEGNPDNPNPPGQDTDNQVIDHTADWLGPLDPEAALEYMKETYSQGLVIINVVPEEYKQDAAFTGSIYLPLTELEERCQEIPADKPVILHCNRGRASADAYPILEEKRKDILVLSYIAGEPLYDEFNTWLEEQNTSDE